MTGPARPLARGGVVPWREWRAWRRYHPIFEQLEDRTVPALVAVGITGITASLDSSGNLIVADAVSGGPSDNLTLQADVANSRYVIHEPNNLLGATGSLAAFAIQPDSHTLYVPFSAVTGSNIYFEPLGTQDTLNVDYSLGSFAAQGETVQFDGASGSDNILNVIGAGTFTQETFNTADVQLTNSAGTSTINFVNLSATNSTVAATNVALNLPSAVQASLQDDGTAGNGVSEVSFSGSVSNSGSISGGFVTTTFANPGGALTVNTAGGSSLIQLAAMDSGFAPATETLNGQAGDTFRLSTANAVPAATVLLVSGATFDLNGSSDTIAGLSGNGTVMNNGSSTATLSVDGAGNASFTGTLANGSGVLALALTGTESQTLTGNNTYTGSTRVNGGTLFLDGRLAGKRRQHRRRRLGCRQPHRRRRQLHHRQTVRQQPFLLVGRRLQPLAGRHRCGSRLRPDHRQRFRQPYRCSARCLAR
jgi:autotransporter-associated beta strand protein